jgi:alanine racemase
MRSDVIAEINTDHIRHNCSAVRACCEPGVKLCAPIKADAYGHGVRIVAPVLASAGVDYAAVATVPEAVELRQIGWRQPILLLGNVLAVADADERYERIQAIVDFDLEITLTDEETLRRLTSAEPGRPIGVHVKLDSGMGRMGVTPQHAGALLDSIRQEPCLALVGYYSHLATADADDTGLAVRQLETFRRSLAEQHERLQRGTLRHLANSAATITMPAAHFDMIRPGFALLGYAPSDSIARRIDLRPALRLVSHLTAIKELPAGHCVGYGQTFTTRRPTRLGIVPAGYVDGFTVALSNAAVVGTPGGDAPVIGRISMDHLAVDLTDLPAMSLGTTVTLIDDRPDRPNSVAAIARRLGTIPYEVTCLLGRRVQRVAVGSEAPPNTPRREVSLGRRLSL